MPLAGFVLLVTDHADHDPGRSNYVLDKKVRVSWAWKATRRSPMVHDGRIQTLRLDVQARTINGSAKSSYAEDLKNASEKAKHLVSLMAKAWDPSAPATCCGNISRKLGQYERMKRKLVPASKDEDGNMDNVWQWCSTPMESFSGAKRAVNAMLVASIFAVDLSTKERVPVVVLGRPPGHHATCAHYIDLSRPHGPHYPSPGGALMSHSLDGGCFYPSCWVAAVHSLREGSSHRPAYIDVDAHKPDGIWKELDRLRSLGKTQRTTLLGHAERCEKVLFASIHLDAYPNPALEGYVEKWSSVDQTIPKGVGNAFEVSVLEELLPQGTARDGTTTNEEVLECYHKFETTLRSRLKRLKPDGIFIGLGFDLHAAEKEIRKDKRVGIGIQAKNYRELIAALPSCGLQPGPVVLTLEGGYTKEAIMDGMQGVLEGMVQMSACRASGKKQHAGIMTVTETRSRSRSDVQTAPKKKARSSV